MHRAKFKLILTGTGFLLSIICFAEQTTDSLSRDLKEITVVATRSERNVLETGIASSASGKTGDAFNRRIGTNNVHDADQFTLHGLKRNILVSLNRADQSSGILLRKETLGNDDVKENIHADNNK